MSAASSNDREWARDVERRLSRLEQPQQIRVSTWSVWEDEAGRLVAGKNGAVVVLAALPDAEGIDVVRYR